MFSNIAGFFKSLFSSAYYSNYGNKAFGNYEHDPHDGYGHYDIWDRAFNESLACFIPEEFYGEAQSILNNQRKYFDQYFDLSEAEEFVLATLCCNILSKMIVWDICSVQTLDRPVDEVAIHTLNTYWIDNPVVKAEPYKLHQLFKEITTDPSDPLIDVIGSEIASELNDRILETMFLKTGRARTIDNTISDLYLEMKVVQENCSKLPTWIVCSHELYETLNSTNTPTHTLDRANIEVVEGTIFDNPIKTLVFKNRNRMGECFIGYTGGEENIVAPMYFCPHLILRLDGPLQTIGDEYDSYMTSSVFCCIESQMRKKMIRKLTIK